MKQTLLLVAGYPATGKTYMCGRILERFPKFEMLSQDRIKERIWDEYGFNNMKEKQGTERMAWDRYYRSMELILSGGGSVLSDYPFSDRQKGHLRRIATDHEVQVITLRLGGDLEVLYQRSLRRDTDNSRHLGHLVSAYHKGDTLKERDCADEFVTREIFMERCRNRGYGLFELGFLMEVDVTDFSKVDYGEILEGLGDYLNEG